MCRSVVGCWDSLWTTKEICLRTVDRQTRLYRRNRRSRMSHPRPRQPTVRTFGRKGYRHLLQWRRRPRTGKRTHHKTMERPHTFWRQCQRIPSADPQLQRPTARRFRHDLLHARLYRKVPLWIVAGRSQRQIRLLHDRNIDIPPYRRRARSYSPTCTGRPHSLLPPSARLHCGSCRRYLLPGDGHGGRP